MSPFDLSGQVAIVTGSTRGIGRAIAESLCRAGSRVVISSRKAEACETVARELNEKYGGETAMAVPCHVGHKEQLRELVERTVSRWGRLDTVVPNAAVNIYHGPSADMPDSAFDALLDANIRGTLWLCNMAVPHMIAGGGGSIIIIASIGGLRGSARLGAYAMSKVAQHQIARNLAVEHGPAGIRANAIAPGLVKTDFAKDIWTNPRWIERVTKELPLRRLGEPEDIAGVAVFLASNAAAFLTGQVIAVDGGAAVA